MQQGMTKTAAVTDDEEDGDELDPRDAEPAVSIGSAQVTQRMAARLRDILSGLGVVGERDRWRRAAEANGRVGERGERERPRGSVRWSGEETRGGAALAILSPRRGRRGGATGTRPCSSCSWRGRRNRARGKEATRGDGGMGRLWWAAAQVDRGFGLFTLFYLFTVLF